MAEAALDPQRNGLVQLRLKENWPQFALLVLINAFVGGMVGIERTVVPLLGTEEFGIASTTLIVSFIVSFGVVKAFANLASQRRNELGHLSVVLRLLRPRRRAHRHPEGDYPASWGILQIATGYLSDRWGRKGLIVVGMWVQAASFCRTAATRQFAGSLLLGLGTAMVYPSLIAAVSDASHPSWRARSLSVYRFWRDLGYAVGALSAGLIADLSIGHKALFCLRSSRVAAAGRERSDMCTAPGAPRRGPEAAWPCRSRGSPR